MNLCCLRDALQAGFLTGEEWSIKWSVNLSASSKRRDGGTGRRSGLKIYPLVSHFFQCRCKNWDLAFFNGVRLVQA
jgi:hypothetical protein